jgi:hypothetical protein
MPDQDLATILVPSDERDAVRALRARVQRVAEQIVAGDESDTTYERFIRLVDEHGVAVRARTAARYGRLVFELEHPGRAEAFAGTD